MVLLGRMGLKYEHKPRHTFPLLEKFCTIVPLKGTLLYTLEDFSNFLLNASEGCLLCEKQCMETWSSAAKSIALL